MLLSLSNFEDLGVPLIDAKSLKKILSSSKKKSSKNSSKKTSKKASKEELFSEILSELNVEPPKKRKNKKATREELFRKILSELNIEQENEDDEDVDDVGSESDEEQDNDSDNQIIIVNKSAKKEFKSKDASIKIASKEVKDSHYEVDVSKDLVVKSDKKYIMVSAYIKEGYLGKYLMKRNFYYFPKNESYANDTFAEIVNKVKKIKKAYHEGGINIKAVTTSIYKIFGGVISDVKFDEEDEIGTNVRRNYFK